MEADTLIPYAIEAKSGAPLYAFDLRDRSPLELGALRFSAYKAEKRSGPALFGCPICSQALYPRLSKKQRPHWAHIDSRDCPLARGRKLSPHELDAIIYQGRQEGEAHKILVEQIVTMAKRDPQIDPKSISTGRYVASSIDGWHGRFPDVYFTKQAFRFAFEVQLAPITLHRLVERIEFYQQSGITLFWVTKDFDSQRFVRSWLWDVVASQGNLVFTVDDEVLRDAESRGVFLLRRITHDARQEKRDERIVSLDEASPSSWVQEFKVRWIEAAGSSWPGALELTRELLSILNLADDALLEICHTVNTLLAIERWIPIGSGHSNPLSVVHAFLESHDGCLGYGLIKAALVNYRREMLRRPKTNELLKRAETRARDGGIKPWTRDDPIGAVRDHLFLDWKLPSSPQD